MRGLGESPQGVGIKLKDGASEGIRTLDTHVGNVMLYQAELRSLPAGNQVMRISAECKNGFEVIFSPCNFTFKIMARARR